MDLNKYEKLQQILKAYGSVAVAFSGGVDSTLLLKVAHDVLGEQAVAVTVRSPLFPDREMMEARDFCRNEEIEQIFIDVKGSAEVFANPPDRCYLCKKSIFTEIAKTAQKHGLTYVAEGSNMDDMKDYRPGHRAIAELGIRSPLREAELTKTEIRELSKMLDLPTWEKPSFACLASRVPYGEEITSEKLEMIDKAEQILSELGMKQYRVRHHGNLARIETDENGFQMLCKRSVRESIHEKFKMIGYAYVSVDLLGYRTGSMNETLTEKDG